MRYVFGECTLDTQRAELARTGRVYRLRRKVFQALIYLLAHAGRVVSKHELCEQVWPQQFVSDAALESVIKAVRQAIGDSGRAQRLLQTVYGQGYRFVAEVTTEDQRPPDRPAMLALARTSTDGSPEMDALATTGFRECDAPASTGEWKLVTVLCCALAAPPPGAALALETHYRQLSALYGWAREAVQRYGGTLQPFAGDQIIAIFGAPLAQEEHAQRAVLAAMELQRRACETGSTRSAEPGSRLQVRLGFHTGQVVVGLFEATPEGAGAVVGDTLTRASALQAQAAPGTIRCSRATARLVHEVAYGSLLQDQRRVLHAWIIKALEALAGDQMGEQVERLAHHAQQGEVWDKAVRYGRQAGEKALTRSAYREAVAAFEQVLEALQHLPESRVTIEQAIDVRMALGHALWLLGDYQRRFASLCQAETLATALGDARRLALISITMVHHGWLMGDTEQAIAYGQRALALAVTLDDRSLQCAAHHPLSRTYFDMGDYRQAIASCRQVVTFFTEDRLPGQAHQWATTAVLSRVWLGLCLAEQGAFAEGLCHATAALHLAETADHPYGRICASFGVGGATSRKARSTTPLTRSNTALSCISAGNPRSYSRGLRHNWATLMSSLAV